MTLSDTDIKIIERNITNEDGDFYGVCGELNKREALRVIREDLEEYGIADEISIKLSDLERFDFWETVVCPSGEHDGFIWWGKPAEEDKVKYLGKGWGYKV